MSWLLVTISAYFLFGAVALVDKYLLKGSIPSPKIYTFYIGVLSISALIFVPFGFLVPGPLEIITSLLAGGIFIFASFGFFNALKLFEASRVVPAIGGILPLFTLGLTYFFFRGEGILGFSEILAFLLLISGSVLIAFKKGQSSILKSFQIVIPTAFLFSLAFVLSKFVYLSQPFWSGFIWIRIGSFLFALFLLFSKEVREELFKKQVSFKPKTSAIFLSNKAVGGLASLLQNWAIALVPLGFLAFINALEGLKYVFLLIFTILISLKFPKILKEEISRKILFQKIAAILLISAGLIVFAL